MTKFEEVFNTRKELFKSYLEGKKTISELINSTDRAVKSVTKGRKKLVTSQEFLYLTSLSKLEKRVEIEACLKRVDLDCEEEYLKVMNIYWRRLSYQSIKLINSLSNNQIAGVYRREGVFVVTLKNSLLSSVFLSPADFKKLSLEKTFKTQPISSKYLENIFGFLSRGHSQKNFLDEILKN